MQGVPPVVCDAQRQRHEQLLSAAATLYPAPIYRSIQPQYKGSHGESRLLPWVKPGPRAPVLGRPLAPDSGHHVAVPKRQSPAVAPDWSYANRRSKAFQDAGRLSAETLRKMVAGRSRRSRRPLLYRFRPADPTDPGDAADLSTP